MRLFTALRKSFDAQKGRIRDLSHAGLTLKAKRKEHMALKRHAVRTAAEQLKLVALAGEIQGLEVQAQA